MANLKDIAATLAILGSGALVMSGCGKDKPATETPSGADAPAADPAEASCGADKAEGGEGSCSGEAAPAEGEGEASCSAEAEGEGSCGAM